MKLIKEFRADYHPRLTKFLTLYFMPIAIIVFVYFAISGYIFYQRDLGSFIKHEVIIDKVILNERSNNKRVETIYTDLLIYPHRLDITFVSTDLNENDKELLSAQLQSGDQVIIYQNDVPINLYGANFFDIVQLEKNNEILVTHYQQKKKWKSISIITGGFAVLLLVWYLSRVYRYKKYGKI